MSRTPLVCALVVGSCLAACGPGVGEMRLAYAPARPADCELDFLKLDMKDIIPGAKYEVLGHVTLGQEGIQDPLQPQYRAIVRPRACGMGGEAVGILASATAAPMAFSMGGTTVDYVVVRRRPVGGSSAPQKF